MDVLKRVVGVKATTKLRLEGRRKDFAHFGGKIHKGGGGVSTTVGIIMIFIHFTNPKLSPILTIPRMGLSEGLLYCELLAGRFCLYGVSGRSLVFVLAS